MEAYGQIYGLKLSFQVMQERSPKSGFLTVYQTKMLLMTSDRLSACQTDRIQIRTAILLVLICIQAFYKNYQQTTKVPASKVRVETNLVKD